MTALYLLADEYRATAQALADLDMPPDVGADTLEAISGDRKGKAQNVALMARSLEADAASVKQWAKDANERAKAIQARADSLRDYLARCMLACGVEKISGPGVALSFRASSAVVIDEPALIPADLMRQPETPPPEPDKTAIAAAIKTGATVPGCELVQGYRLAVK